MTSNGYWADVAGKRFSRRIAIKAAGAGSVGAVALGLVGCGGGNSDGGGSQGPAGLVAKPQDTTKSAKTGGTYRDVSNADVASFDPHVQLGALVTSRTYPRIFTGNPGLNGDPPDGSFEGDLAESWEFAPDGTQMTLKLRPTAKWDSRSPTNGRTIDAQDMAFSWDRFVALHPLAAVLANKSSPDGPIISMTAIDSRTVVAKLTEFLPEMTLNLSSSRFLTAPREAESGFDLRGEVRGWNAWTLQEYKASSSFTFVKNPNWYRKDRPFIDRWDIPIVPDYAQRLAQLKAGNLFTTDVRLEDILTVKNDVPALQMYEAEFSTSVQPTLRFGLNSADSPFWDQRVRQAISMLQDRDTWISVFGAVEKFKAAGIEVATGWNTHASVEGGVKPQDKEFGPNAKYYYHDVAEAKKLLAAAGYANGFTTDAIYSSNQQTLFSQNDAILGMLAEGGIKGNIKIWDTTGDFRSKERNGHGNWDGIGFDGGGASPSAASFLWRRYNRTGTVFAGFDPNGKDRMRGDPKVDDLTTKMSREADAKKRQALVDDLLRYLAGTMYEVPAGGQAKGYTLVWPAVMNSNVFRTNNPPVERDILLWLDQTKPPFV